MAGNVVTTAVCSRGDVEQIPLPHVEINRVIKAHQSKLTTRLPRLYSTKSTLPTTILIMSWSGLRRVMMW